MATNFEILSFCFVSLNISFSLCVNSVGPAKTLTRLDWKIGHFPIVLLPTCRRFSKSGERGREGGGLLRHSLREIRSGFSV